MIDYIFKNTQILSCRDEILKFSLLLVIALLLFLLFIKFLCVVGVLPTGIIPSFVWYFVIIFSFLNALLFCAESFTDMTQRIRFVSKADNDVFISKEKILEFIDFLKLLAELKTANFSRNFTKKTAESLKGNLNEYEGLFAKLIIKEEAISSASSETGELEIIQKELNRIKSEKNKNLDKETKENFEEREKILSAKIEHKKTFQSSIELVNAKKLLMIDITHELLIKLKKMDLEIDTQDENLEEDLKQKLLNTREEIQLMEEALSLVYAKGKSR